jgi:hypothetical protein
MKDTLVFERGEHIYLVAPVAPFDPAPNELEELAFAEDLKKLAPNENIGWLRGQYVEAERANENGAVWSSDELAIKSLTPMFMPVTVMHDPRSAVGLIADTKLLTREQHNVPRSRIDTTLGIWRHRFPASVGRSGGELRAGVAHAVDGVPAAVLRLWRVRAPFSEAAGRC